MTIDLYTYFRSSAAFRVRIALALKGINATHHFVSLIKGEQHGDAYSAINPQQLVPALAVEGQVITQSLAIIEYLDEAFADTPPLVWGSALQRARIRSLALTVACDIHPVANLRVLSHLRAELAQDDDGISRWCHHWMMIGFSAFEAALVQPIDASCRAGQHCVGDAVSMADVVLVPQVFNAQRFGVDMSGYPETMKRFHAAMALEAFEGAQPARQADAF